MVKHRTLGLLAFFASVIDEEIDPNTARQAVQWRQQEHQRNHAANNKGQRIVKKTETDETYRIKGHQGHQHSNPKRNGQCVADVRCSEVETRLTGEALATVVARLLHVGQLAEHVRILTLVQVALVASRTLKPQYRVELCSF